MNRAGAFEKAYNKVVKFIEGVMREAYTTPSQLNESRLEIVKDGDDGCFYAIVLVHKDGRQYDLGQLLRDDEKFLPGSSFCFTRDWNYGWVVMFPRGYMKAQVALTALLHEIGHARRRASYGQQIPTAWERVRALPVILVRYAKATLEGKPITEEDAWPLWLYKRVIRCRAVEERMASAWALRQLRRLQKAGYGVMPNARAKAYIRMFIQAALMTYEGNYIRGLVVRGELRQALRVVTEEASFTSRPFAQTLRHIIYCRTYRG